MRLLLHIGSYKTGSTSIQRLASEYSGDLLAAGIYYPRGLLPYFKEQHSYLLRYFIKGDTVSLTSFFDKVLILAQQHNASTVFLSGEDFSATPVALIPDIMTFLRRYFSSIKVGIVFRTKRDWLISQYKHQLRSAPSVSILNFTNVMKMTFLPASLISAWNSQLSDSKLCVYFYENMRNDLLRLFYYDFLGFPLNTTHVVAKENVSLDYISAQYVNYLLSDRKSNHVSTIFNIYCEVFRGYRFLHPSENDMADLLNNLVPDDEWVLDLNGVSPDILLKPTGANKVMEVDMSRFSQLYAEFTSAVAKHFF